MLIFHLYSNNRRPTAHGDVVEHQARVPGGAGIVEASRGHLVAVPTGTGSP